LAIRNACDLTSEAKVGDLTMSNKLLKAKIATLEGGLTRKRLSHFYGPRQRQKNMPIDEFGRFSLIRRCHFRHRLSVLLQAKTHSHRSGIR
jgi:hypothetical protein